MATPWSAAFATGSRIRPFPASAPRPRSTAAACASSSRATSIRRGTICASCPRCSRSGATIAPTRPRSSRWWCCSRKAPRRTRSPSSGNCGPGSNRSAAKDDWLGQQPDPRVAHDPDDPHFAMSFGGEAFFVVGLHPEASRPGRRFEVPAMVFNLHDQFEQLRAEGRYGPLSSAIRERDRALAGSDNPMLAEHGTISPARQYSGRAVGADWRCPYSGRRGGGNNQRWSMKSRRAAAPPSRSPRARG